MLRRTMWMVYFCAICLAWANISFSSEKGIYITQWNAENTAFLQSLIHKAKHADITTFVIDLEKTSKIYDRNIAMVKQSGIHYVARIIMFEGGGTAEQIKNPAVWQRKYVLVDKAISLGAAQIQLDYIRYSSKQRPSPENAQDILKIIAWYKEKVSAKHVPLQVDVFGVASFGESKYIGQNVQLFAQQLDAICPMVYPSHYEPFKQHFNTPYATVYDSLNSIKKLFHNKPPIKVIAYIELSNYHYPMSHAHTLEYIRAQLKAVSDAGLDGWYVWSPHNRYDNLFYLLQNPSLRD